MFKRLVRNLMYFFSLLHIPYFLARTYFLFPAAFFCPRVNLWRITSSGTAKSASREHIIILQYPIELKYQNKNFHTVISIFGKKKCSGVKFVVFGGLWRHSYQKESLCCNLIKMYCRYKTNKTSYHIETKIILIKIIYFYLEALQSDS